MLKPSAAPCGEPQLDLVGDLLRRAGDDPVPRPPPSRPMQLADGQVLPAGQVDDELVAALVRPRSSSRRAARGSGPSSGRSDRSTPSMPGELGQRVVRDDQLLQLGRERPRLGLGASRSPARCRAGS